MTEIWQTFGIPLLIVVAAWVVSWLANLLLVRLIKRLTKRTQTRLDDAIFKASKNPLRLAILALGVEIALGRVPQIPPTWQPEIDRTFFVIYTGLAFLFLFRLITGLIGWYDAEVVHRTATTLDDRFLDLLRRILLTILTITILVVILGTFGIEIGAVITTLGIGSLAIALAAQDTLSNMFAGFTLMIDQPFKVGDRVALLEIDTWGDVQDIGLRSTRILTRDHRMVTVPNSVISNGSIINYSVPSTKYRVQTHVGIAYGTDVDVARQVMIEAIRAENWVMKNERVEALFLEFGDSALVFRVRCWIEHYVETRRIIDKMNTALYKALQAAEIEIPFPQRDLHLVSTQIDLGRE